VDEGLIHRLWAPSFFLFQSWGAPELGACLHVIRDRLSKRVLQRID
jgi:predicted acyltransferase